MNIKGLKTRNGITLIEVSLALALISVILLALTNILGISLKNWELSGKRNELIQNGRVAMERITSDLRYAVSITTFTDDVLEFKTRYLENEDDSVEVIKYYKSGSNLYRQVDDQKDPPVIADWIESFRITLRDSNGQAVAQAAQAAFTEVNLVMSDGKESFTLTSCANMRTYNP
ncbi:MAG: prepilin-type N-terminal cleavage/methylation domain-containing protein [Candidatus Omnitrophica bacterium]|nr:prepilin-type N-terminal cleavage/methylation domain-containing protein [Candidatus Omnitrophota bacterium]